jgi:F0F1-type ATP synthase membrane subunit c/vacuolar-type H+-ATPase subunit K
MSNNPLRQYFRQPAIYIRLPSNGQFYPPGAINMPPTGELPVYPMTAIDEITYRTPDALFNGQATVNVLQSCVPDIKDVWSTPAMDIDTLLIAIRIASYGHDMDFGTKCPKCGHECEHTVDLRSVLDRMRTPDYSASLKSGDLEIFFRPMTYKNINDNNALQYENQKLLQMLPDSDVPDTDKMSALGAALTRITAITVQALSQGIAVVKTPQALVSEPEYHEELLKNCDRDLFNRIRDHIVELKRQAEMPPMNLNCPECKNQYEQAVTLDMSSFFVPAS